MRLWQDGVIALLAAIGLSSIFWYFLRTLFFLPVTNHPALVLICAKGSGEGLEQQVRALAVLRRQRGAVSAILLVDCGLNEEGEKLCRALSHMEHSVILCEIGEIGNYIT